MDSIPNGTPLTGKLSARNWPAQFGGRGSAKPALPTPINESSMETTGVCFSAMLRPKDGVPVKTTAHATAKRMTTAKMVNALRMAVSSMMIELNRFAESTGMVDTSDIRFKVSRYGNAPFATGNCRFAEFKTLWRNSSTCDTFSLFTGGLRGSFRFSTFHASPADRFSSTAVYAPCPPTRWKFLESCSFGHDAYTA